MNAKWVVVAAGLLSLAGCDALTDFKLSRAQQELRQECLGNFTVTCVNKTIDFNIEVLESVPFHGPQDKDAIVAAFGDKGWELWEESRDEVTGEVIELFESKRPGMFSRWFLGDAQPLDGKGVHQLDEGDLKPISDRITEIFVKKAKAAGLQLNAQAPAAAPAPQAPVAQAPVQPPAAASAASLTAAIDSAIVDEIGDDGGSEYPEARQVLEVDLNGDGNTDAVVLFTIEGSGGGNGAYQTLAAFYREAGGWTLKQKTVVGGATDVQALGQNLFGVKTLTHSDDDPRCCPSLESVEKYQWNGVGFVQVVNAG